MDIATANDRVIPFIAFDVVCTEPAEDGVITELSGDGVVAVVSSESIVERITCVGEIGRSREVEALDICQFPRVFEREIDCGANGVLTFVKVFDKIHRLAIGGVVIITRSTDE